MHWVYSHGIVKSWTKLSDFHFSFLLIFILHSFLSVFTYYVHVHVGLLWLLGIFNFLSFCTVVFLNFW